MDYQMDYGECTVGEVYEINPKTRVFKVQVVDYNGKTGKHVFTLDQIRELADESNGHANERSFFKKALAKIEALEPKEEKKEPEPDQVVGE